MRTINQDAKKTSFTWMDRIYRIIHINTPLMVWIKRRFVRVVEPTPEELIQYIAKRNGMVAFLVPREFPDQVAAMAVIQTLAEQAGLVVTLCCPKAGLRNILLSKIECARRN